MHAWLDVCMYVCISACMYICMCVCTYVCVFLWLYVCVLCVCCVCVCECVWVYVWVLVYINIDVHPISVYSEPIPYDALSRVQNHRRKQAADMCILCAWHGPPNRCDMTRPAAWNDSFKPSKIEGRRREARGRKSSLTRWAAPDCHRYLLVPPLRCVLWERERERMREKERGKERKREINTHIHTHIHTQ